MTEEWKVCYISQRGNTFEVSNLGNVRRQKDGKIMKQYPQKSGYVAVILDGCWKMIHTLVANEFLSETQMNGDRVDHISTDRADNRVENLRWVDAKGNANNPQTKINMSNAQKARKNKKEENKHMGTKFCGEGIIVLNKDLKDKCDEIFRKFTNTLEPTHLTAHDGLYKFSLSNREDEIVDICKAMLEENINIIYGAQVTFTCVNGEGSVYDEPFESIISFEVIGGQLYTDCLRSRLPYKWYENNGDNARFQKDYEEGRKETERKRREKEKEPKYPDYPDGLPF